MKSIDKSAFALFQKLRSRYTPVTLGNEKGETTSEPSEARFFNFIYKEGETPVGPITISLVDARAMKVFYSDSVIDNMENKAAWYSFLRELRAFAKRNLLMFDARDIAKSQLQPRDFAWLGKIDGQLNKNDVSISESTMYGTKRKSYQKLESVKMIVQHTKSVDEDVPGARSRSIENIYLERSDGERYKMPYNSLTGARAMARHVTEGGTPYDDMGQHILAMVKEMRDLGQFARMSRTIANEDEEAGSIRTKVVERFHDVKKTLHRLRNAAAYKNYTESYTPDDESDMDTTDVDALKERLTRKVWNNKMEDLLPAVSRTLNSKKSLTLKDDPKADSMITMTKFDDNKALHDYIMSDIASRATDPEVAKFAANYKSDMPRAVEMSKQYVSDISKLSKDPAYKAKVRKTVTTSTQKPVATEDSFDKWATSLVEGLTDSEDYADKVMAASEFNNHMTMENIYSIVNEYVSATGGHDVNVDEVAQVIMDRVGISEGTTSGTVGTIPTSANSAVTAQDKAAQMKKVNDVSKLTKAAGLNVNSNDIAQTLAAQDAGKNLPMNGAKAAIGLGDKLVKSAASDPAKAAQLAALMRKFSQTESLDILESGSRLVRENPENRITLGMGGEKKKKAMAFIDRMYNSYYANPMSGDEFVMMFGEDKLARVSLTTSNTVPGAVEIKWFSTYPMKEGIGKAAMAELQAEAAKEGITLTLYPWDKGNVSQSMLVRIYKKMGFAPIKGGAKSMVWTPPSAPKAAVPAQEELVTEKSIQVKGDEDGDGDVDADDVAIAANKRKHMKDASETDLFAESLSLLKRITGL